jgi:site-specific recombinase XerD
MFHQLFQNPRAIKRHQAAPLLEERSRYLAHCAAQGRTKSSLRLIAQHLLVFIDYLPLTGGGEIEMEQLYAAADRWVNRQPHPPDRTDFYYGRMRFISDARQWLHFLGRLRQPQALLRPYTHMIEAYAAYMTQERGLSPHTIRSRRWVLEQFLSRFWQQQRPFDQIEIGDIDAAIARKGEQDGYARTSIQAYANVLRSFFRYAEHQGWCAPGLAAAIRSPRQFADASLPKGPSWEDVQQLLRTTEGDRPKDVRDRAIILLFAVYGMRAGEVRQLRLEDLDWEQECIDVRRPKSRRRQVYPLSYTVGEAILRYLREVRPRVPDREVFLRLKAPLGPLSSGVLYDVVSDRLRSLSLPLSHYGPHALRHACATRLLAQGLSMKEIGDHLGHRKADTTRVYAKVDLVGLRQVANFDLGDLW